jgi:hypothetical protein
MWLRRNERQFINQPQVWLLPRRFAGPNGRGLRGDIAGKPVQ